MSAAPPEFDQDQLRQLAGELLADEAFKREIAEFIRDETDQVRKDLRRLLHIPADQHVSDGELVARIGTAYIAAEQLLKAFLETQRPEGAA